MVDATRTMVDATACCTSYVAVHACVWCTGVRPETRACPSWDNFDRCFYCFWQAESTDCCGQFGRRRTNCRRHSSSGPHGILGMYACMYKCKHACVWLYACMHACTGLKMWMLLCVYIHTACRYTHIATPWLKGSDGDRQITCGHTVWYMHTTCMHICIQHVCVHVCARTPLYITYIYLHNIDWYMAAEQDQCVPARPANSKIG